MITKLLPKKILFQNVEILDPLNGTNKKGNILIINGKIAEIGKFDQPSGIKIVDAKGLTLTQGFCDLHVHFKSPSFIPNNK